MKRTTAVYIFLLGMIAGACAVRLVGALCRPKPPHAAEIAAGISRDLVLDEAQQAKLLTFFALHDEKMRAFQKEASERFDALREENDARIAAILTPEQKAKFEAMRAQWRRRRGPPEEMRGMPPPPDAK